MTSSQGPVPETPAAHASSPLQVLSEIEQGRLWLALVEQGARCDLLEQKLAAVERSKSWRLTSPLRKFVSRMDGWRGRKTGRPALQAAPASVSGSPPPRVAHDWLLKLLPAREKGRPRILVDVTELALEDLGAGVQRVTRRVLAELLLDPPSGYDVAPVRLMADGGYCVASVFLASFLGLPEKSLGGDYVLDPKVGDRFLGLDFCRDRAAELAVGLAKLRTAGVPVTLTVPDVLPLTNPGWFPPRIEASYEQWLRVLATQSDRALCISADSGAALRRQLEARGLPVPAQGIAVMCLGADLLPLPLPAREPLPVRTGATTRVLMVGTVEPRKAHAQALAAFEMLWSRDLPFELVVAGHGGWMVDDLLDRLRTHPELGKRLHWIDGPDDRTLLALYQGCDALLMASRGEGFGLPVAEAGRLGLGLILRDLPVFREVAGEYATYFNGDTGGVIADAVIAHQQRARNPRPMEEWAVWASCAQSIRRVLALTGAGAGRDETRLGNQE